MTHHVHRQGFCIGSIYFLCKSYATQQNKVSSSRCKKKVDEHLERVQVTSLSPTNQNEAFGLFFYLFFLSRRKVKDILNNLDMWSNNVSQQWTSVSSWSFSRFPSGCGIVLNVVWNYGLRSHTWPQAYLFWVPFLPWRLQKYAFMVVLDRRQETKCLLLVFHWKKKLIALILKDKNCFSMVKTWRGLNTTNHILIEVLIHSLMYKTSKLVSTVLKDLSMK